MSVDVAVVPAAGRGTRMRPATRVLPKALITVVDRPSVQWVVEEAVLAGVKEVIVVVDLEAGHLVHGHFLEGEPLPGLEHVQIRPVVQEEPHGLGHAVAEAGEMVDGRPFFCLLADNIVRPGVDMLTPLAEAASSPEVSVVSLRALDDAGLSAYGVVDTPDSSSAVIEVTGAVEKPGPVMAPSRLGLVGRYLFAPSILEILRKIPTGVGGEIQLTDAIDELARAGLCRGVVGDEDLLDVGTPAGLVRGASALAEALGVT